MNDTTEPPGYTKLDSPSSNISSELLESRQGHEHRHLGRTEETDPSKGEQSPSIWTATGTAGRCGQPAGLRLLRLPGGALPHRGCFAPGPWPHRLRRLHLGHPRRPFLGTGTPPPELLHRPAGDRRDLRRREKAVRGTGRTHRHATTRRRPSSTRPASSASSATTSKAFADGPARTKASRSFRCSPKGSRGTSGKATMPPAEPCSSSWERATPPASSPSASTSWGISTWPGELWIIREYFARMGIQTRRQHHRRRPGERSAARPRRCAQRGPVLRRHHGSGQDDEGQIRHAVPAGFLLRGRGHGRIALLGGPVF